MKSIVCFSTSVVTSVTALSLMNRIPYSKSIFKTQLYSSDFKDHEEKPINDPLGLYSKDSPERKNEIIMSAEDDQTLATEGRNIRDPMGLYPEDAPEREAGLILTKVVPPVIEEKVIRDPFGLYPEDASEREKGLIQPMETIPTQDGVLKDPLNIYESKSELDTKAVMSASLPFLTRPKMLDGSLPGDRGFDPFNFSSNARSLEWYRSAEIKHSRVAMLAAVGWPISEILDKKLATVFDLKPLLDSEDRVPSLLNGGLSRTPPLFWVAALVATAAIEIVDILNYNNSKEKGTEYIPGMLGFDPLNLFGETADERMYKMEAELFNGRLGMLAVTGFAIQEWWTHQSVVNETPLFFKPIFTILSGQ